MRHRSALAHMSERFTWEGRPLSLFKSDHPRTIDRVIDYFGSDGSGHERTPSRFSDERSGSPGR